MDAYALKTMVDVRTRQARQAPAVPEPPGGPAVQGSERLPDAGLARQAWRLYTPPYMELPGLFGERALDQHMQLYAGYLSGAKAAEGAPPLERRRLYETDDVAGAVLHELFFEGLTAMPLPPSIAVQGALIGRYGSIDSWWSEMTEAGDAAKGWAVTAVCSEEPTDLTVFSLESHDHGLPPGYIPICVADVYEHAYWMDHGTDKRGYLRTMQKFLNWEVLDERLIRAAR